MIRITSRRSPLVLAGALLAGALLAGPPLAGLAATGAAGATTSSGARSAGRSSAPKATYGGTIKFAEAPDSAPDDIFPVTTAADQTGYNVDQFINLMYPALFVPSPNQPTFDFAHSIGNRPVWSKGDTVATVTLKHYRWSDGAAVTARDLVFYINLALAEGTSYGNFAGPTQFPDNLRSYSAVNATTLRLVLKSPVNPTYYDDDGIGYLTPLPRQAWDKESAKGAVGNFDETPGGAKKVLAFLQAAASDTSTYTTDPLWKTVDGPFKLASFGGASSPDVFVANPRYSGPKPYVSTFEEIPFTSDSAEFTSLKAGSSTLSYGAIPSEDIPAAASVRSEGFNVTATPAWGFAFMIPNTKNPEVGPILSQAYVRQALAHLTDQKTMIDHFLGGLGSPTYGVVPVAPRDNVFVSRGEASNPYPYSVGAAERLLERHHWRVVPGGVDRCERGGAAGCGTGITQGEQLSLNLLVASGSTFRAESTDLFQSDAAKAGVRIQATTRDFNTVVADVAPCQLPKDKGTPTCDWQLGEFGFLGQSTFPAIEGVLNTGGAFNAGEYSNPTLDRLVAQATTTSSLATFFQAEDLVARQEPWIWEPLPDTVTATAKNLAGYGLTSEFAGATGYIQPQYWYFTR